MFIFCILQNSTSYFRPVKNKFVIHVKRTFGYGKIYNSEFRNNGLMWFERQTYLRYAGTTRLATVVELVSRAARFSAIITYRCSVDTR